MPEASGGEKTLPASPAKRRRAREQGQVAKSQDLSAAWTLLIALLALRFLGHGIFEQLVALLQRFFQDAHTLLIETNTAQTMAVEVMWGVAVCALPFMLFMLLGGLAIHVAQIGFVFSGYPLTPKLERLNPVTGMQRFFSARSFVELVKSMFKVLVIGLIVWLTLRDRTEQVLALMQVEPSAFVREAAVLSGVLWWRIVVAMLVLGILDYTFQRWQYETELMMTVQEAREELRQLEGDPRIKQRIRHIQRQLAFQRMMAEVPKADVVITNPVTYAVALRYEPQRMDAPRVVAKGARLVAERIRNLAAEHDVPIVEKPELARALWRTVDVGQSVPEDLFRAVAEVLAFVYRIDRRAEKVRERAEMAAA